MLIGDDHVLMLNGIKAVLEPKYEVVAAVEDGRRLVESALRLRPDVIVLDVSMPELNGLEAAKQIKNVLGVHPKLIFLSMHTNVMYLRKAIDAGASAYVLKTGVVEELVTAVNEVIKGKTYFSPTFNKEVVCDLLSRAGKPVRQQDELTTRQVEILQLVAEGKPNKEIAHALQISEKTVDFHRGRMMARLGVHSTAELVRVACEQGLIPMSTPD